MNQSMPKHEKLSRNISIIMNEYVDFLPVMLRLLLNDKMPSCAARHLVLDSTW